MTREVGLGWVPLWPSDITPGLTVKALSRLHRCRDVARLMRRLDVQHLTLF